MSRKQIPSPQKKAQTKPSGRSEELDEIIDRMPMACCQQYGEFAASFAQSTGGSEEGRVYSCRAKPCFYRGCTEDCGYNGQNQHGGCAITNIQRQLSR